MTFKTGYKFFATVKDHVKYDGKTNPLRLFSYCGQNLICTREYNPHSKEWFKTTPGHGPFFLMDTLEEAERYLGEYSRHPIYKVQYIPYKYKGLLTVRHMLVVDLLCDGEIFDRFWNKGGVGLDYFDTTQVPEGTVFASSFRLLERIR